jgi:hypothetical protein
MPSTNGKRTVSQRRFNSLSSSTNIAPTSTVGSVEEVELHVLGADVYVSQDGTAASSTNGLLVASGTRYTCRGPYTDLYVIEAAASADVRAVFLGPKKPEFVGA